MIATENLRGLESSPSRALMDSKHTWVRTFDCFGRGQILGAARHVNRRERRWWGEAPELTPGFREGSE
jgi:hypothetical protein